MMLRFSGIALSCLLLISCAPDNSSPAETTSEQVQGQQLPITAKAEMGGEVIKLEVAETQQQQAMGLMYREKLPPDRGMLFPLDPPQKPNFWMKNVQIPLDMIFLSDGEIRAIAPEVPPCESKPCPTYGPNEPIDQVIELAGGRAEELGLEVGDTITIQYK